MAFYPDAKTPYFMLYHPNLAPRKAVRLTNSEKRFDSKLLIGRYYNAELDRSIEITQQQGIDFQLLYNGAQLNAIRILPDLLLTDGYQIGLTYNTEGELLGLLISGGRLRNVSFSKI
jgi:hypothetical protein